MYIRFKQKIFNKPDPTLLKPISIYSLPAYKSKENLSDCKKYFKGYFDHNYFEYGLNDAQPKLPRQRVFLKKMIEGKNGTFLEVYNSLKKPLEKLALDQNRICQILFSQDEECKRLRLNIDFKNYSAYFLMKKENSRMFYVLDVRHASGEYVAYVEPVSDQSILRGIIEYRFVVSA